MRPSNAASLPIPSTAIAFRPEFLDFRRGIRVGNLEDNERITRILKLALEAHYQQGFVTERWGRGVFWQWIAFLPRANREAKPISSHVSFGCSKFFISVDTDEKLFKCGLQIERGHLKTPRSSSGFQLCSDWDWHRLVKGLRTGTPLEKELRRLVLREGFVLFAGSWEGQNFNYSKDTLPATTKLARLLRDVSPNQWAGFQLFYPMGEEEVRSATGPDLAESVLAVFNEVTPLMNLTMQIQLPTSLGAG